MVVLVERWPAVVQWLRGLARQGVDGNLCGVATAVVLVVWSDGLLSCCGSEDWLQQGVDGRRS